MEKGKTERRSRNGAPECGGEDAEKIVRAAITGLRCRSDPHRLEVLFVEPGLTSQVHL